MVQSRLLIRENRHADLAMWPNAGTEGRKIIGESVYLAKKKKKEKNTREGKILFEAEVFRWMRFYFRFYFLFQREE